MRGPPPYGGPCLGNPRKSGFPLKQGPRYQEPDKKILRKGKHLPFRNIFLFGCERGSRGTQTDPMVTRKTSPSNRVLFEGLDFSVTWCAQGYPCAHPDFHTWGCPRGAPPSMEILETRLFSGPFGNPEKTEAPGFSYQSMRIQDLSKKIIGF